MTLLRLVGGDLIVHSAVACDEATMAAIDALGPVKYVIVPNQYHRLDAHGYATRYPQALVLTAPAARHRVAEVVRVDGTFDQVPGDPHVRWEAMDGVPAEAVWIHREISGAVTLVFNDVLMNLPDRLPGVQGFLMGLLGSTGGPKVTWLAKRGLVKDRGKLKAHLQGLAELPGLTRLVPAHGALIEGDAAAVLRSVAGKL